MDTFEITGKYKMNIEKIDNQHQYLFNLLNRLAKLIDTKGSEEELGILISDFMNYTVFHFKDEEEVMSSEGYPGLAEHIEIHKGFVKAVTDVVEKYEGNKFLRFKFFNIVMNLLLNHIEKVDYQFAQFYKNKHNVQV